MKKRVLSALFVLLLCLGGTAAAADGEGAGGTAGERSVKVVVRGVKPGYYFGSVWDGDELLTLFDTVVGPDGVLNETVDVGRELRTDDRLRVGVSGANTGEPDAVYSVQVETSGGGSPGGSTGGSPSGGNAGGSTGGSSSGGNAGGSTGDKPSGGGTGGSSGGSTGSSGGGSSRRRDSDGDAGSHSDSRGNMPLFQPAAPETVTPEASGFADVAAGAYYYEAVQWAVKTGITAGTSTGWFSPEAPCTRAQLVSFLWRAAGSPLVEGEARFSDVAPHAYYYNAVLWAASQGIAAGTGEGRFRPDETVTRGQTAAMLHRAAGSPAAGGSNPFGDVAPGAYYAGAVRWAVETGVTAGTSAGAFSPEAPCTRAQIVTFLYRDRVRETNE